MITCSRYGLATNMGLISMNTIMIKQEFSETLSDKTKRMTKGTSNIKRHRNQKNTYDGCPNFIYEQKVKYKFF